MPVFSLECQDAEQHWRLELVQGQMALERVSLVGCPCVQGLLWETTGSRRRLVICKEGVQERLTFSFSGVPKP